MVKTKSFDASIRIHPERLRTVNEVDESLDKIINAETVLGCRCGVAIIVNAQGVYYSITSEQEAAQEMANRGVHERYEDFYPASFYVNRKNDLLNKSGYAP